MKSLIKKLVEAYGPSGFEDQMRDLIRQIQAELGKTTQEIAARYLASGVALERFEALGCRNSHLSLTHDGGHEGLDVHEQSRIYEVLDEPVVLGRVHQRFGVAGRDEPEGPVLADLPRLKGSLARIDDDRPAIEDVLARQEEVGHGAQGVDVSAMIDNRPVAGGLFRSRATCTNCRSRP